MAELTSWGDAFRGVYDTRYTDFDISQCKMRQDTKLTFLPLLDLETFRGV